MRHFPGDHAAVLAGFAAAPERQFRFLRGALQARTRAAGRVTAGAMHMPDARAWSPSCDIASADQVLDRHPGLMEEGPCVRREHGDPQHTL